MVSPAFAGLPSFVSDEKEDSMNALGSHHDPDRDGHANPSRPYSHTEGAEGNRGKRASGRIKRGDFPFDSLVRLVGLFPLRIVIVLAGISLILKVSAWTDAQSGEAILLGIFCYIAGFVAIGVELLYGHLANLIRGALYYAISKAEEVWERG